MCANKSRETIYQSSRGFAKKWWAIGCLGVSLLVIAVISYRRSCLETDYPKAFSDERFKQITVGMPVESVFSGLGYPFVFTVHSLAPGGTWNPPVNWQLPHDYTNIMDARPFLSSETNRVVLEYSRPRKGDTFRARQIVVSSGRVIKVDAYEYWGD